MGTSMTCSGTGRSMSKKRMTSGSCSTVCGTQEGSRRNRRCAPWCAARPVTRRSPLPRLLWSSVSVELGAQPPRPCPSSVPVGRRALLQPPPCRSCGGRLRTGPLRRSAAHVATMSAGVVAFAAMRSRGHHAATCRPLGF